MASLSDIKQYTQPPSDGLATPPDSMAASVSSSSAPGGHRRSSSPPPPPRQWKFSTECATVENPSLSLKDQHGSSSVPIYQTATFKGMPGQEFDYTRSGNPTRSFLEHHLKKLSGCASAHAVSSGMSALDVILRLVKPGDTVLAGDDLYGGTNRLLGWLGTDGGVTVHHCNTSDASALEPFLVPGQNKVAMVLLESPTNPMLKIADLKAVVDVVRKGAPNALIVADNTMMSPYLQRPLDMGIDISYDSGTKFLSGHHDLMAGVVTCRTEETGKRISWFTNAMGTALAPFDCFLLLRGLKTLPLRMDRQQASCNLIAQYLHALGFLVHFPGLPSDPGHKLHFSQATGAGAVMSFETGDVALSEAVTGGTRIWGVSVSFGAVNSLISMPCLMSHASIPAHLRAERGLPEDLIRLCVGIEDPLDLLDDLETSLVDAGAIRARSAFLPTPPADRATEAWVLARAAAFERVRPSVKDVTDALAGQTLAGREGREEGQAKEEQEEIVVSAPGKVILFGEHAVVHGVTGIAASVDLRCYAHLSSTPSTSPSSSSPSAPTVTLSLPDLSFTQTWTASVLPWDLAPPPSPSSEATAPTSLDPALLARVEELAEAANANPRERVSIAAFLYLVVCVGHGRPQSSLAFTARSALPMGAGLGSSAAYSTCIASALLKHHRLLSSPIPASSSPSAAGPSTTLDAPALDTVDQWAFLAEKVIHGNPSGIDNAVSVRGGAVVFARRIEGKQEGGMKSIKSFASVRLLVTDSRVGRDTKSLVAGVSARLAAEPDVILPLLAAIQTISDKVEALLAADGSLPRSELVSSLETLITENQAHLAALGVSHPALEQIIALAGAAPFGLHTKLTGAGGGGCAVTLIPDHLPASTLDALMAALTAAGFAPYLTAVGGAGVGLSTPHAPVEASAQRLEDGLRARSVAELEGWARGVGEWTFA